MASSEDEPIPFRRLEEMGYAELAEPLEEFLEDATNVTLIQPLVVVGWIPRKFYLFFRAKPYARIFSGLIKRVIGFGLFATGNPPPLQELIDSGGVVTDFEKVITDFVITKEYRAVMGLVQANLVEKHGHYFVTGKAVPPGKECGYTAPPWLKILRKMPLFSENTQKNLLLVHVDGDGRYAHGTRWQDGKFRYVQQGVIRVSHSLARKAETHGISVPFLHIQLLHTFDLTRREVRVTVSAAGVPNQTYFTVVNNRLQVRHEHRMLGLTFEQLSAIFAQKAPDPTVIPEPFGADPYVVPSVVAQTVNEYKFG